MGKDLMDLSVDVSGLKFQNPVVILSGCMEYDDDFQECIPVNQLAAYITKTITLAERSGNPTPRTCEAAAGLINSVGLQNKGLYYYIKETLPELKELINIPIIASIAGFTIEEYASVASRLDKEDTVSALEVNISCPNLEKGISENTIFAQDAYMSYGVVKAVKESTAKPVIVKLAPEVTDIKAIAQAVVDAGCDALTVANTYPAMAVDIKFRRPKLGAVTGGLSGPCIKPLTLKKVWDVHTTVDVPLIASGGIMNAEDALEYIIAGASLIGLGTVNFINPRAGLEIIKGIRSYLTENKLKYNELIGSLKVEKI